MGINNRAAMAAALLLASAGCTPKVAIEAPKEPIAINLNIKLDADVRFRLEDRAKIDIKERPVFSVTSATVSRGASTTRSIASPRAEPAPEIIGERFDGYVAPRNASPSKATRDLVARINAERFAIYEERATEEKVPIAAVGVIYAQEIVRHAPKGTYVLDASGVWRQI